MCGYGAARTVLADLKAHHTSRRSIRERSTLIGRAAKERDARRRAYVVAYRFTRYLRKGMGDVLAVVLVIGGTAALRWIVAIARETQASYATLLRRRIRRS